jgi:acetyl-CoA acetyltransferase family protein
MDVFICDAVRTPIGRGKADGALHGIHPVDLLAHVLAPFKSYPVEDIICGCVTATGEQGTNIGRLAGLKAGFPIEVPGLQLNRFCGSGQQAIHFAAQAIAAGDMEMAIGCGVESMSRVPMGADAALTDEFRADFPCKLLHQGISAELIAEKWGVSREEMDDFAVESHCRASSATPDGILPLNGLTRDEGVRSNPDVARMRALKPVFRTDGVVTAANSSQISDGAGAVLLANEAAAEKFGLEKRARIVARAVVGSDPELMLTGPIDATRKALKMAGLTAADIDAYEINEAFACVPIVWSREIQPPAGRLNIEGGAIAHGHPLGGTGAVLMTKLVNILKRNGGRYGLQSMCIGYGMATATIIELV